MPLVAPVTSTNSALHTLKRRVPTYAATAGRYRTLLRIKCDALSYGRSASYAFFAISFVMKGPFNMGLEPVFVKSRSQFSVVNTSVACSYQASQTEMAIQCSFFLDLSGRTRRRNLYSERQIGRLDWYCPRAWCHHSRRRDGRGSITVSGTTLRKG